MTAWNDTVKKTFEEGRLSNPNYQFKQALKDAKKYYKKGQVAVVDVAEKTGKVVKSAAKKTGRAVKKVIKKTRKAFSKKKKGKKYGKSRKYRKRN